MFRAAAAIPAAAALALVAWAAKDNARKKRKSAVKRPVFLSFHYKRDVNRVQLIRNIGSIDQQPLLSAQEWESVKAKGPAAVERWIDEQMKYKQAVVVLIGRETASRPWVQYEIRKAHAAGKPLLGVYIHSVSSFGKIDRKGPDPFVALGLRGIPTVNPTWWSSDQTYSNIANGLAGWIEDAIKLRHSAA